MTDKDWEPDDLLDAPEVAEILHVSSKTVNRLIAYGRGELPAVKVGRRWKVRRSDLKEYLQKRSGSSGRSLAIDTLADPTIFDDKNDMLHLELQKKRLEITSAALEIATRMVSSLHPDSDVETRIVLTRTIMSELLEATNTQSLEQIIQNIPPYVGRQ